MAFHQGEVMSFFFLVWYTQGGRIVMEEVAEVDGNPL